MPKSRATADLEERIETLEAALREKDVAVAEVEASLMAQEALIERLKELEEHAYRSGFADGGIYKGNGVSVEDALGDYYRMKVFDAFTPLRKRANAAVMGGEEE